MTEKPVSLPADMLQGVCALLQNLSDKIRLCHECAVEARERADEMPDHEAKADFLNTEIRWLQLAHSYEFGERLGDFTRESLRQANLRQAKLARRS